MGFFTDLKEDLTQAVNELMPEEELKDAGTAEVAEADGDIQVGGDIFAMETAEDTMEEAAIDMAELDALLERVDTIQVPEEMDITKISDDVDGADEVWAPENVVNEAEQESTWSDVDMAETEVLLTEEEHVQESDLEASIREAFGEKNQGYGVSEKMDIQMKNVADETAIITAGMIITGDIASEGSMDVIGTINGDVEILGKLNITGSIIGNSRAAEIFADGAKITGEIVSEGSVKIGQSSVIIGNISSNSAVIAGAVKGDIDVRGPVVLDASAIVMGNIKSKSVQINNGAVIEGMCSQSYADVNPTSFFDEYKTPTKK